MDATIMYPYAPRAASFGSGRRERASTCSCKYRTSTLNQAGCCYTRLKADPPLLSYDRQWYTKTYDGQTASLIEVLDKEPLHKSTGKCQRKARPSTATTCTEADLDQIPKDDNFYNFITVRGQNICYLERPNVEREVSEGSLIDQAIQSVQDATTARLSELSLIDSDGNAPSKPNAPHPSPEPLEERFESGKEGFCSDEKDYNDAYTSWTSSLDEYFSLLGTKYFENDLQRGVRKNAIRSSSVCSTQPMEEVKATNQVQSDEDECDKARLICSRSGSKKWLELRLPTADVEKDSECYHTREDPAMENHRGSCGQELPKSENSISDIATTPDLTVEAKKHVTGRSAVLRHKGSGKDSLEGLGRSITSSSSAKFNREGVVKKCRSFSVSSNPEPIVKCKNVEFLSEEDLYGARFFMSKSAFETSLYMDFLKEKERLAKKKSQDTAMKQEEADARRDSIVSRLKRRSVQDSTPPEIQITSKQPLPRRKLQSPIIQDHVDAESGTLSGVEERKLKQTSCERFARSLKSEKVGSGLRRTKSECKTNETAIWRNISGIDATKPVQEATTDGEIRRQDEQGVTDRNEDSAESNTASRETSSRNVTSTNKQSSTDQNVCLLGGKVQVKSCENTARTVHVCKPRSARKIRFMEPDRAGKSTRPGTAVIPRFNKGKNQSVAEGIDTKTKKPRPKSSTQNNSDAKKRVGAKERPTSAIIRRTFSQSSTSNQAKVISVQSWNVKLRNSKIVLSDRKPNNVKGKQRAVSAKTQRLSSNPSPPQRSKSAPPRKLENIGDAAMFDVIQEEQKVSEECSKVFEAFQRKGISMSIDTLRRALMPPSEMAKPYSRRNVPHPSRLLSKPSAWNAS